MRYLMVKAVDILTVDLSTDNYWTAQLMGEFGDGEARQWRWVPNGEGADWVAIQAHYTPAYHDSLASSQYAWAIASVDGSGAPLDFFIETMLSER